MTRCSSDRAAALARRALGGAIALAAAASAATASAATAPAADPAARSPRAADPAARFTPAEWKRLRAGKVLTRAVPVAGSGVKRGRGVAIVDAPPAAAERVISDFDRYEEIFPRTVEGKLLKREAGGEILAYEYLDMPWPVKDIWFILRLKRTALEGGGATIAWSLVKGTCRRNSGSWRLEPIDGGARTLATYEVWLELEGPVPDFLVTYGTKTTIPDIFEALRTFARHPRYAGRGAR